MSGDEVVMRVYPILVQRELEVSGSESSPQSYSAGLEEITALESSPQSYSAGL